MRASRSALLCIICCALSLGAQTTEAVSGIPGGSSDSNKANGVADSATLDLMGKLNASVNSQVNVMMFGAKGDCVNDDHDAIISAQRAAMALASGRTTAAALYFPKPPGGCYLTSAIAWLGIALEGQPSGIPAHYGGVVIKGKPGQDILEVQDPSIAATTYGSSWVIENIAFELDDSAAGIYGHRWPGRWVDDAGMTAQSAILHSKHANISCGDVGQAVQVNGAGPGGANLITTVSAVYPCWTNSASVGTGAGWQRVTLAVAASTSVSNAQAYISIVGLPVTATIGAAVIAMDNRNANMADWPGGTKQGRGGLYNVMRNVNFATTSLALGGKNNTAAIFTQGQQALYGLRADHVNAQRFTFGVVQACAETNSYQGSCSGDFEHWDHIDLNGITYPWIQYNGLFNHFSDVQLYASYGMQFLNLQNANFDVFNNAFFENCGFENGSMTVGKIGWRLEGGGHILNSVSFGGGSGAQTTYLNTDNLICNGCVWSSTLELNGTNNRVLGSNADDSTANVLDGGRGNQISESYLSIPMYSLPMDQDWSPVPTKGTNVAGRFVRDFVQDGNQTPYVLDDLFIWPKDVIFQGYGNPYSQYYEDDAASPTGGFLRFSNSWRAEAFSQFMHTSTKGAIKPTVNLPVGLITLMFLAKCLTVGNFTMNINSWNGTSAGLVARQTFACRKSYEQYSMRAMVSNYGSSGSIFFNGNSSTPFDVAWMYLRPDLHDINGKILTPGNAIATGPSSSKPNDIVTYNSISGDLKDSGTQISSLASLASPTFTGTPRAPIAESCNANLTQIATEGYVQNCGSVIGITNVSFTVGTSTVNANTCTPPSKEKMKGLVATSVVLVSPAMDIGTIKGWGSVGGLTVMAWPTADTLNWRVCNQTSGDITPSASVTFNVGAK
jgi:hypothetical protein